jgi:acyl-CoA synthetase (AMP-forming)/AMP-acid ligase II
MSEVSDSEASAAWTPGEGRRRDSLVSVLERVAAARPSSVALEREDGTVLRWREWRRAAGRIAHGLVEDGVSAGDRIVLQFDNEHVLEYAMAFFGVLESGAVAVPVPARTPAHELARIRADCRAARIVHADERSGDAPDGRSVFEYLASPQRYLPERVRATDPNQPAQIVYSSGTTGLPKGVCASHANLSGHLGAGGAGAWPTSRERLLHAMPIGTIAAQVMLLGALDGAFRPLAMKRFLPVRAAELITSRDVRSLLLVPAMARLLLAAVGEHATFEGVDRVILTGSSCPANVGLRLCAIFPRARIETSYTSTEAGPAAVSMEFDPHRPNCVGAPDSNSEVAITSPAGERCPPHETGTVWLRAKHVPPRSYVNEALSPEVFADDGWVKTGDIGYVDTEGLLYLVDRAADVIDVGGLKVSPLELEDVLRECPGVDDVCVWGTADRITGQRVAAAVVKREESLDVRTLQAHAAARLQHHKVPRVVLFVDEIPRNALGKPLKPALESHYQALRARHAPAHG